MMKITKVNKLNFLVKISRKVVLLLLSMCLLTVTAFGAGKPTKKSNYSIKFPKDAAITCSTPIPDDIEIFTKKKDGDVLTIEVSDEEMPASDPSACYEIHRTYRVQDIDDWDGVSPPTVVGRDEDCDGLTGDEDLWVNVRPLGKDGETAYYDRDDNEGNNEPKKDIKLTSCDGMTNPQGYWLNLPSNAYWEYTQIITVYDDVNAPVIIIENNDPFCSYDYINCTGLVEVPFTVMESCPSNGFILEISLDVFADGGVDAILDNADVLGGSAPDFIIGGNYPIGEHLFILEVQNICGLSTIIEIPFAVVDCKSPTPICINGLPIELAPVIPPADVDGDGDVDFATMEVLASDFIAAILTDCSGPIQLSINRSGEAPDINQGSLTLTCDDPEIMAVQIYAWDAAGNSDYCKTYVLIQDNLSFCQQGAARILENVQNNTATGEFQLFQNQPNPFHNETSINFYLPKAEEATLKIWDVSGKIHKYIRGHFAAGQNRIVINRSELPVKGMLFYELRSGRQTAVRKMIILD